MTKKTVETLMNPSSYILLKNEEYGQQSTCVRKRGSLKWKRTYENGCEMFCDPNWERNGLKPKRFKVIFEGTKAEAKEKQAVCDEYHKLNKTPNGTVGNQESWKRYSENGVSAAQ